jgi:hypothetical protein
MYIIALYSGSPQLVYISAMLSCCCVYYIPNVSIDAPSSSLMSASLLPALHTDPEVWKRYSDEIRYPITASTCSWSAPQMHLSELYISEVLVGSQLADMLMS